MKFNLGKTAPVSTQGTSSQLPAGKISKAKFVSAGPELIEKKDKSATFDVIKIKFTGVGEEASKTFEHTIFEPKPGDDVRKPNNFGYENPSNTEEIEFLIQHLLAAVAPKTSKQIIDKGEIQLDTWKGLGEFVKQATAKSAGVETEIKLMPDKEGRPRFPGYVLGISKAGEAYPRTNFIGKDLTFTANELKQIETRASAAPTPMATISKAIDTVNATVTDDDLDLDIDSI